MQADEIRLECLKLAHAQGREIPQVLDRATRYAEFVQGPSSGNTRPILTAPTKKTAGNPDPFK